ncbi:hypothetical protein ABZ215_15660 [Amycolatopsis sp. NPDC006131]|uniref:hypothetical protein n=1 Tax=Amycolatopsis sp. NPDC006131 TaxID=3156731 RepID=UPI0033ADC627
MPTWVAALVALAAITVTYVACVRPMLRGRGHCGMPGESGPNPEVDRQVAELREQLRVLRAQDSLDSGRVSSSKPTPPAEAGRAGDADG